MLIATVKQKGSTHENNQMRLFIGIPNDQSDSTRLTNESTPIARYRFVKILCWIKNNPIVNSRLVSTNLRLFVNLNICSRIPDLGMRH